MSDSLGGEEVQPSIVDANAAGFLHVTHVDMVRDEAKMWGDGWVEGYRVHSLHCH